MIHYKKRTMIVDLIDVEVEVEYSLYPACKGAREGGLQLEPDEDAGIDIECVTIHGKNIDNMNKPCRIDITEYVDCDALAENLWDIENDIS